MIEYTQAGDWVPGEQWDWLETIGKIYGFTIAVPVTILSFALSWLVQKPTRLLAFLIVVAIAWFAAVRLLAAF